MSAGPASSGPASGGQPRVGFIGLGSQGAPMARRIVEAGLPLTVWARRAETLAPFADTAAVTAGSVRELGAAVDIACVCVLDDAGVEEVVAGPDGLLAGLAPGGVIVVHSTVHPDTCIRLAAHAAESGIALIDAPVSGGQPMADQGKLLVMTGGDPAVVERCRPVFETYGNPVVYLGPLGAGQRAKLINNMLLTANLGVAESAFALAGQMGLDLTQLGVVLAHGSGGSFGAGMVARTGGALAPLSPVVGPLLQKDVRIVAALAESDGVKPGVVLDAADAALDSLGASR